MMASWRLSFWIAVAAAAALPIGCSLINEYQEVPLGPGGGSGGAGGGQSCTGAEQCDDSDDCTEDLCEAGECAHSSMPDQSPCEDGEGTAGVCVDGQCTVGCTSENAPIVCDDHNACTIDTCNLSSNECAYEGLNNTEAPGAQQVAGDCALIMCQGGEEQQIIDDVDLPDDGNDCTEDSCHEGNPSNVPEPMGSACTDADNDDAARCDAQGACVECNGPADCTSLPSDDECQWRTCIAGVCGQDFTAADTPVAMQQLGDCEVEVCDGSGGTQTNVQDTDLPDDGNDCTEDVCTNGTPSNPNEPANTACGAQGALYCDGQGTCTGCNNSAQCPVDTFCRDNFCNGGTNNCDYTDTANDTVLPGTSQSSGDCQELQCNGTGGIKSVAINDPFDDGNECTSDLCVNGSPVNSARPINYACSQSGGTYCDGNGTCVECNSSNQCPTAPDCQYATCGSHSCGFGDEPNSTPAPPSYQTAGDCNTVVCDGTGGVNGNVPENNDIPNDGNECTADSCAGGAPVFPNLPDGTLCVPDSSYCNGVEECQSGSCVGPGDPCPGPDNDASCKESCDETLDNCEGPDPNGSACDGGLGPSSGTCNGGTGLCELTCGHQPTPPGGACPGICNGGCANDICTIDCTGEKVCNNTTLACPAGFGCEVLCHGRETCEYSTISCPDDYLCAVSCADEQGCKDVVLTCSMLGVCTVDCSADKDTCRELEQHCGQNQCSTTCAGVPYPDTICNTSCNCQGCP